MLSPAPSWPLLEPITGPVRKCRWCAFATPRTPKGAAELWRHVRAKHATEDWSDKTRGKGELMARKKTDAEKTHEAQDAQPPLIKMSREELEEAGQSLAGKSSELEELEAAHKASREGQSVERKKVKGEIAAIASTIRNQGR